MLYLSCNSFPTFPFLAFIYIWKKEEEQEGGQGQWRIGRNSGGTGNRLGTVWCGVDWGGRLETGTGGTALRLWGVETWPTPVHLAWHALEKPRKKHLNFFAVESASLPASFPFSFSFLPLPLPHPSSLLSSHPCLLPLLSTSLSLYSYLYMYPSLPTPAPQYSVMHVCNVSSSQLIINKWWWVSGVNLTCGRGKLIII